VYKGQGEGREWGKTWEAVQFSVADKPYNYLGNCCMT